MYLLVHNETGRRQREGYEPFGTIISRHRTLRGAERAFDKGNRSLKKYTACFKMQSIGTFDEIVEVDRDGRVIENSTFNTEE